MRDFVLVVVAAGLCGGLVAWGVLPLLIEAPAAPQLGPVKVELEPSYDRDQLALGLGLASCTAAALAFGLTHGLLSVGRRRRRR